MGFISTVLYNVRNMKKAKKIREMGKENLLALEDEEFYEAALAEYRKISEGVNMITQGGVT